MTVAISEGEATTNSPEIRLEPCGCPLCGGREAKPLLESGDHFCGLPGRFRVTRCRSCGHVYMNPRPTADSLPACYPSDYGPHRSAPGSASKSGAPPASRAVRISKLVPGLRALYYWLTESSSQIVPPPPVEQAAALEIGAATGTFLERLREAGWQPQGVELMPAPAAIAAARGFPMHVGTLESASFPPASFDAVFAWMVVEHLPDPRSALEAVGRILRPDGRFYFSVPNFNCLERRTFRSSWQGLDLPRHLQHFTPRTLRRLLQECGFETEKIIHQANMLSFVGSCGFALKRCGWQSLGERCLDFTDNPRQLPQLVMSPAARLLALLRQSPRLTCIARKV